MITQILCHCFDGMSKQTQIRMNLFIHWNKCSLDANTSVLKFSFKNTMLTKFHNSHHFPQITMFFIALRTKWSPILSFVNVHYSITHVIRKKGFVKPRTPHHCHCGSDNSGLARQPKRSVCLGLGIHKKDRYTNLVDSLVIIRLHACPNRTGNVLSE